MLRAKFQSLFWAVFLEKKKKSGLKLTELADTLGVNKSYVSRSFSKPPNWQIDKIADFADALDLDLEICAVDKVSGEVFTPQGKKSVFTVAQNGTHEPKAKSNAGSGVVIARTMEVNG